MNKTYALTGNGVFQSGYDPDEGRFYPMTLDQVMEFSTRWGIPLQRYPFDEKIQGTNDRREGSFYAAHAEVKALVAVNPDPILVSRDMCDHCENYFKQYAQKSRQTLWVGTPNAIRCFKVDGTVHDTDLTCNGTYGPGKTWELRYEGEKTILAIKDINAFTPAFTLREHAVYNPTPVATTISHRPNRFTEIEKVDYFSDGSLETSSKDIHGREASTRVSKGNRGAVHDFYNGIKEKVPGHHLFGRDK